MLHVPCTGLTLPQDSACVSNTRSWRTCGFTYGLLALDFASAVADCRSFCSWGIMFIYFPRFVICELEILLLEGRLRSLDCARPGTVANCTIARAGLAR